MGKRLAIEHHLIRPNEVIELLEMMGGKNTDNADGCSFLYYTLCIPKINNPNNDKVICGFTNLKMQNDHFAIFTLEKFWKKYPYKVGDKAVYIDDNDIVVISEIIWDDTVGDIFYNVKRIDEDDCFLCPSELLKPYKKIQSDNMETKTHRGYYTTEEETTNKSKKVAWFTFWDNDFADKVELDLSNRELIQENGKWFVVKKKPKYPKTYEECCEMLGIEEDLWFVYEDIDANHINPACISNYRMRRLDLYHNLEKLLICRDAYWKIAGEQMGLDKPWEPEYVALEDNTYFTIQTFNGEIDKSATSHRNAILAFPTIEMRDAFYENFKDLIEQCKELL